jgi:hypothetical protein
MNIDWNEAPEATHYDPTDRNFLKQVCGVSLVWHHGKGWAYHYGQYPQNLTNLGRLIVRPEQVAWTGEGLPPVGIEIEALLPGLGSTTYFWQRAKVVHGSLSDSTGEVLVFSLETSRPAWVDEFRPIRTPEQIAVMLMEWLIYRGPKK